MFVDGRTLNGNTLQADLCIVGAGAAGVSMALEFAGCTLQVVLLESGDLDIDEQTQALYDGENASFVEFPLSTVRLRYFGGTTNHWGGFTHPLSEFDFAPRPFYPVSGWPIAQRDVAAYYPRAGVLCQLGRMDYDGVESWQRQAGFVPLALPGAPIVPAVGQFSPPTRFGTAYRLQLKLAANVTVVLNSNVQDLVSGPGGTRIETAGVKCFGGAAFVVAARRFVLAMGGLETTRLLLLSRRHQPRMLGDGHDMLGRCYMDHPGLSGTVKLA